MIKLIEDVCSFLFTKQCKNMDKIDLRKKRVRQVIFPSFCLEGDGSVGADLFSLFYCPIEVMHNTKCKVDIAAIKKVEFRDENI